MIDVPNVLNSQPDDPRLLLSAPFRAVHFVYGLFHPEVRPLSGHALIGSLAALGFGEEASRGIVLRLRRAGFLESRRTGREAAYALSARSRVLLDGVASRSTQPPPPWDGTFQALLVQIPAVERAYREQLRRQAAYAGFASPLPGLLIAPYESSLALLEPLLASRPEAVVITAGRLALDPAGAASLARRAWDLETMAAALHREAGLMETAAAAAEGDRAREGGDALEHLWRSIGPFFALLSASPPLPTPLLPADWPLDAARAAFVRLALAVAPAARMHVEDLDGARPGTRPVLPTPATHHEEDAQP